MKRKYTDTQEFQMWKHSVRKSVAKLSKIRSRRNRKSYELENDIKTAFNYLEDELNRVSG